MSNIDRRCTTAFMMRDCGNYGRLQYMNNTRNMSIKQHRRPRGFRPCPGPICRPGSASGGVPRADARAASLSCRHTRTVAAVYREDLAGAEVRRASEMRDRPRNVMRLTDAADGEFAAPTCRYMASRSASDDVAPAASSLPLRETALTRMGVDFDRPARGQVRSMAPQVLAPTVQPVRGPGRWRCRWSATIEPPARHRLSAARLQAASARPDQRSSNACRDLRQSAVASSSLSS